MWYRDSYKSKALSDGKLYGDIAFLSDSLCSGRACGTRGGTEAAFMIIRSFRDAGLMCMGDGYSQHFFAGKGIVGHNIIGMLEGSAKYHSDRYVIVGTHYDGLGTLHGNLYPGADSNASGVAALLALAKMFSTTKMIGRTYAVNYIFVAFDCNSMSMAGSEALWRMIRNGDLKDPVTGKPVTKDKILLMANIDQVGCTFSPVNEGREDYLIMLGRNSLNRNCRNLLDWCNEHYGFGMDLSYDYYRSDNFTKMFYRLSDQRVFVDNRVPAVLFTSGITMNNNKTYDSPDTINLEALRKRIVLIFHWLERLY
ncbi:MAG: M28 family metallopeptidase [Candidatus Cryptobacteroides sp.]